MSEPTTAVVKAAAPVSPVKAVESVIETEVAEHPHWLTADEFKAAVALLARLWPKRL